MSFQPVLITEIELSEPFGEFSNQNLTNRVPYGAAMLVVRLHHTVIGTVEIPFDRPSLRPLDYAPIIWAQLATEINLHLEQDELQPITDLSPAGIQIQGEPRCITSLNNFLRDAPFVSVVVCTHDRTSFLRESLPHLLALNYPKYEVIVVDNAPSTSETYDYIQDEYQDNDIVRYVREDQAGLSWARNCGIRHARADYIAFTDDDAFADPSWLDYLMRNFFDSGEIACVTGLALPLELEHEAQIWFEQFGGLGNGFNRQVFDMEENRGDHALYPYTVAQYGAGVNMVFRTEILRKLNGFIVQINQADDISMFVKIITNGYKIVYEPNGFVYHKHRADYEGLRRQIYNYGIGLSNFLIHMIVTDWTWLLRVAPRIPVAVLHLLSAKSYKNENKEIGYPAELTWLERKGILVGPIKYWQYARKIRGLHSVVEQESN
jgi:glycosyltransferase involved in cell wall biosynthesis